MAPEPDDDPNPPDQLPGDDERDPRGRPRGAAIIREAAARVCRREQLELAKAATTHAANPEAWHAWLQGYYLAPEAVYPRLLQESLCLSLVESTHEKATWETKRKGARRMMSITWTMHDALRAGLVTRDGNGFKGVSRSGRPSNWDKYPRAMLRHRAATELARAVYPDVTSGLYAPNELGDGSEVIEAELIDA